MTRGLEDFSLFVRRWLPALVWMIIILAASTDWGSGVNSFTLIKPILLWLNPHIPEREIYEINFLARKVMHVVQFAVLGALVWKTRRPLWHTPQSGDWRLAATALLTAAVFSILSETIQLLFPETRGASLTDVFLDMGGTVLSLCIILFLLRKSPGVRSERGFRAGKSHPMKILISADLHLDITANQKFPPLEQLRKALLQTKPDACVIAGDFGTAEDAEEWLSQLKKAVPDIPLAICLGNHEHWVKQTLWDSLPSPARVRKEIWRPGTEAAGIHCLDFENLEFDDVVITGGYGHFDLGMRDAHLVADGKPAKMGDYLAGEFAGMLWKDMRNIPNAADTLHEESELQAREIRARLAKAAGTSKQMIVVTHTVPFHELIGHPHPPGSLKRFFNAYSGNTLVGDALADFRENAQLAVCGHTHAHVSQRHIQGIRCANVGSDYGVLRFVLYDSENRTVSEIGPLSR